MLCLKCGHDHVTLDTDCAKCQNYLGVTSNNRGYLPQLETLEQELKAGTITPAEASEWLHRLEVALQYMIHQLDETGRKMAAMELDETQSGTLGGFMMPVREGLESMLQAVSELDPEGDWGEDIWASLRENQIKIIRGNEGVLFLSNTLLGFALEGGMDPQEIMKQLHPAAAAAAEGAEAQPAATE